MNKSEFLIYIGNRIRTRQIDLGLSQSTLAQRIGKNQDSISGYELGNRAIRIRELPLLAKALDVSENYFLPQETPNSFTGLSPRVREILSPAINKLFEIKEEVDLLLEEQAIEDDELNFQILELIIHGKNEQNLTEIDRELIELWKLSDSKK